MKRIWPFTFNLVHFAALSALVPFLVLFYQRLGFGGAQIGLLTGVPPLITLFAAPLWTGLADARRWHKPVMAVGIALCAVTVALLPAFSGFPAVFLTIILFNIFLSPVSPLADSATLTMLGEDRALYGRIRLGGTIGWGLFAPVAGLLVQNYGLKISFWGFSALMLANLFVSQRFAYGTAGEAIPRQGSIRSLLTSRRWIRFLFLAFLGGVGTFSVASYLFPYMAELGASESTMGIASALATLTEIPAFFFGNRLMRKLGSRNLLLLSLVMFAVRSLLYAAVDNAFLVLAIQAFGGMIFPAMWLAGVTYADAHAPPGLKSSAQGLFGAISFGVGSAVSGFAGGPLLESIGGRGMFLVLGILLFAGLGVAETVRRLFPENEEPPQTMVVSSDK